MTEFEAKAVADAINRMFCKSHFSICEVDKCMRVTGATETSDYDALSLYHCKHFKDMDVETKKFIYRATVENICNVDDFPEIRLSLPSERMEGLIIAKMPESEDVLEKRQSLIQRIFGTSS